MENEYIYKYMTFEQFVDLIENKRLYLTRIDLWEDCWEGIYYKRLLEYVLNTLKALPKVKREAMQGNIEQELVLTKKRIYGQSWTLLDKESDAMWRIYSQQKTGIRIKIKLENVKKCIEEMILLEPYRSIVEDKEVNHKEISYKEPNYEDYKIKESTKLNSFTFDSELLYFKRKEFEHEKEYRFSVGLDRIKMLYLGTKENNMGERSLFQEVVEKIKTEKVIYYSIPNNYIEEIFLDPRATNYFEETFNMYCKNRKLSNYSKSKLYTIG